MAHDLQRISPSAVKTAETVVRHFFVVVPRAITLEDCVKDPAVWARVQGDVNSRLGLCDTIDLIDEDRTVLWRGLTVVGVSPVRFSKPQSIITFEGSDVLYEHAGLRVVPRGNAFAIARKARGGQGEADAWIPESMEFATEAAARNELHKRLPRQVA